jgi:60 kDa SS-A/Ro ribonucleoprotein
MSRSYLDAIQPVRPLAAHEAQTHEGGIASVADKWTRLNRFLILGSDGGNFYQPSRELTLENVGVVKECLAENGLRTVLQIVNISHEGRAPKNDPAILALAAASVFGDDETRYEAFWAMTKVCRTATHLYHFIAYREALGGGWGRSMRRLTQHWLTSRDVEWLTYQALKYPSRDGWSMRDVLRLAHPKVSDAKMNTLFRYITKGHNPYFDPRDEGTVAWWAKEPWVKQIQARDWIHIHTKTEEATESEVVRMIRDNRLTREMLPTSWLNSAAVWEALLEEMPLHAMIRNLGKMTAVGLLKDRSNATYKLCQRLMDVEYVRKSRVHPLAVLVALKTYEQGHGEKGKLTWNPVKGIINTLDETFYATFPNVESTGKRIRLAVDVSGSMDGSQIAGMPITAREGAAAMALVTMAADPGTTEIVGYSTSLVRINLRPSMRLDEVIRIVKDIPMGGTYCTLPIEQAMQSKAEFDAFVSYTDSETWNGGVRGRVYMMHGQQHIPSGDTADEALYKYRNVVGIPARHAVVAMTANRFSIANPNDPLQLDVAGFDTATPGILSGFIAGDI